MAGNQWFTSYLLDALGRAGMAPELLINVDSALAKGTSGYMDLAPQAQSLCVDIYRPSSFLLDSAEDRSALGDREIQALLVFGWHRLIPEWLLEHCAQGAYGVHGGPKAPPRCRGRAVFNWALILGCTQFSMYLFQLTPRPDDGRLVDMTSFDLLPEDDIASVYNKNCVVTKRMVLHHLPAILKGTAKLRSQPPGEPSYLPGRKPEEGGIDWRQSARRIADLVRAIAPPYQGAFTSLGDMRIELQRANVFDTLIEFEAEPGTIVEVFPAGEFVVAAGEHTVYVREYECEDRSLITPGERLRPVSGVQPPDPVL